MEQSTPYQPNEAEKLLIAALRSGEYPQAAYALRTKAGFCCLGVACDVYHKLTGKLGWVEHEAVFSFGLRVMDDEDRTPQIDSLPPEVQEWLGWSENEGRLNKTAFLLGGRLSGLNDAGTPFSEIADLIEAGKVQRA